MKIRWYSEAVKDLNQIYEYYATKSLRAASMIYDSIVEETEILENHPYLAAIEQVLDNCPERYRSLLVAKGKYKVVYYVEGYVIYIVQVFGCRQSPEKLKDTPKRRI